MFGQELWSCDIIGPCFIDGTVIGETDHETWHGVVPELEVSPLTDKSDIIR